MKKIIVLFLAIFMIFGTITTSEAAEIKLGWNPPTLNTDGSPLLDLTYNVIRYGVKGTALTNEIVVGNTNSVTITGLKRGVVYKVMIKSGNSWNIESVYSNPFKFKIGLFRTVEIFSND